MVGDTILIKDISINGNDNLTNADQLSETLTDNTINALGIDASSRTIWINGQPYGNAYVNIKGDGNIERPIGAEIFNDFEHNIASGEYSHAEGIGTITNNEAEHASGKYNQSNADTRFSVGIGTSDTNRKNAVEVMQSGGVYINNIGKYDGKNPDESYDIATYLPNMVNITYEDLCKLKRNSKLVPGQQYRIINYNTTVNEKGTEYTSAGHQFDIIVTADSESTLHEEARAIQHTDNETDYFSKCDLSAWKVWYSLDNDTERFDWADDSENGKGVIYRMIDEFNNDVHYDFKNIQFKRYKITGCPNCTKLIGKYTAREDSKYVIDKSQYILAYTFTQIDKDRNILDHSIVGATTPNTSGYYVGVYDNKISSVSSYMYRSSGKPTQFQYRLNNICFISDKSESTDVSYGCYSNTFGSNCYSMTFGTSCNSNTFGEYCYENTFGDAIWFQSIGGDCHNNIFGDGHKYNTIGDGCSNNIFGTNYIYNTIGCKCYNNEFGNNYSHNSFGNSNYAFKLGDNLQSNTFLNYCSNIVFGSDSFSTEKYSYYKNNFFGNNCRYILFKETENFGDSENPIYIQNYNFSQGLQGTSDEYLTIDGERNRGYETYVSRDTDGTIKESVIADKLDRVIEISHNDLVTLRDSVGLIPGQQYRITDYTCTTLETYTRSEEHVFDIIVTADSENKLNEEARAIQHENDPTKYFDNSNLSAWKIWYCLDNDTDRFAWASKKGQYIQVAYNNGYFNAIYIGSKEIDNTIYYLWYNKEISFRDSGDDYNYIGTKSMSPSSDDYYDIIRDDGDPNIKYVQYGNIISYIVVPEDGKGVIYRMIDECNNDIPYDFKNIRFKHPDDNASPYYYTFATTNTEDNTDASLSITAGCFSNTIKPYINGPLSLHFINRILFLGYGCNNNSFGSNCYNNSFSGGCSNNSFGNYFHDNAFGYNCHNNVFGNDCNSNLFGDSCSSNSFGNGCMYIKFASDYLASTKYSYYQNNHFGDGCQYIVFTGKGNASSSQQVQNYNFAQGVEGTANPYLSIDGERDRAYETYISKDTNGIVKESVIANKLDKMIEISYGDLVRLRSNSKLVPGQQYRITDYETTTTQSGTTSAGHQFDIIVTADDESTLNEVARAIKHDGDTYFTEAGANLNGWKLWYTLDNDTNRFAWALGDDKYLSITYSVNSEIKRFYYVRYIDDYTYNGTNYAMWYLDEGHRLGTTTIDVNATCTLFEKTGDSPFEPSGSEVGARYYITDNTGADGGKGVIYRMIDEFNNDIPYDFKNIQFKYPNDTETYTYYYYTFASDNTENNNDYSLDKSNECHSNTIKPYIKITSTGKQMQLNRIMFIGGRGFVRNTFGNNCYGNAFNYACNNNTFGDRCSYNIFGTDCSNNVFGNGCVYNIFRNDCSSNNFGNGCCYNIFDTDYFYFNNIDNWVKYVHVTANPTTTISKLATNYHITSSVKGIRETTDGRQNILVSPGRSYITTVDMDSGGTVKYYCVADLLNNREPPQPK